MIPPCSCYSEPAKWKNPFATQKTEKPYLDFIEVARNVSTWVVSRVELFGSVSDLRVTKFLAKFEPDKCSVEHNQNKFVTLNEAFILQ